MPKTLLKIQVGTGQVVEATSNYDFSNFIPTNTDRYKYLVVDDSTGTLALQTGVNASIGSSSSSVFQPYTMNSDGTLTDLPTQPVDVPVASLTDSTVSPVITTIPNISEQVLSGTGYGSFLANELCFQSDITPEVFNFYSINGVTVQEYTPTVGSIGASDTTIAGRGALKFKGTYQDLPAVRAGGLKIPGGYSLQNCPYHLVSGHIYLDQSLPSAYDPVLLTLCRSITAGSTQDSYAMVYENGSGRLKFNFSTSGDSATGFVNSMNASPVGITLNQWHHVAAAFYYDGVSSSVATYFNGSRVATISAVNSGYLRSTNQPLCMGSDQYGNHPWRGWVDDWIVSGGTTLAALRGFTQGTGASLPTKHQEAGDYTVAYMSMDGPIGTSLVPCDRGRRVAACVDGFDRFGNLYVSSVDVDDFSVHGITLFVGVCGGYQVSGVCGAANVFGYNSGACLVVSSVQSRFGLTQEKAYRQNLADLSYHLVLGQAEMKGERGGRTGDFANLMAKSLSDFNGYTFTFKPSQDQINQIKYLYDDITINGRTASYFLEDTSGNLFTFSTGGIKALYTDIVDYHAIALSSANSLKTRISGSTQSAQLKRIDGITNEQMVFKLAAFADKNSSVYISTKSKLTGSFREPETVLLTDIKEPPRKGG